MAEKSVLMANSDLRCGQRVGVMNLKIDGSPNNFDTVAFNCNLPAGHFEGCKFEGKELTVIRNRI